MNVSAFLLLGSNLGDRAATLMRAQHQLAAAGRIVNASGFYQTAAWGKTDEPEFINQAIELQTALPAQTLLDMCLDIEQALGRERVVKWGARTLDIDIIFYGNAVINTSTLQVPHPRMHLRRFVLVPMAEIAAEVVDPVSGKRVRELLAVCEDMLEVRRL
jgi:2-amino-4-hydroxy-6-hydroxymethyldihydropteridine diphosphokinase